MNCSEMNARDLRAAFAAEMRRRADRILRVRAIGPACAADANTMTAARDAWGRAAYARILRAERCA